MKGNYTPRPVDTSDIQFPEELTTLLESISFQIHERWALNRLQEGWRYGTKRDDAMKLTPCLVPYDQLSEEEKNYDRETAIATIKFIMSQGYEIKKKTQSTQ